MNAQRRQQLAALDRSLLSLLNERARLVREIEQGGARGDLSSTEDLLRRNKGPLDALAIEDILAAVGRACRTVAEKETR